MTKKIVKKNSSNNSLHSNTKKKLSIQFNLDGFSFCISDEKLQKDIYFTTYHFDTKQLHPEALLVKIKEIFKTDKNLQFDFSSVLVVHQNTLSTLVPDAYFNENNLNSYLEHNIKTLKTDYISYDNLGFLNCKNVYIPYVNINNYLFQNFGEFEYKHHSSVLIEKLLSYKNSVDKKVFVNVSKSEFEIIVLEAENLLFYNSFSYDTKEDFIYYILFTLEQLKLDVEKISLVFTGEITENTNIYKITYQYIRNITFLESRNPIFKSLDITKHSNFILLG